MDVKLIVVGGKNAGREIPVPAPKFLIGRAEDCHLRPGSDLVSRHHCAILIDQGLALVRDFGSRSGTFVNEERVRSERELKTGDKLKIGTLEFEVQLSVVVGGKKKPKVHSISEAAARTVQSAGGLPDDEVDISSLFGEDEEDTPAAVKPAETKPAATEPVKAETPAAKAPEKQSLLGRFEQRGKPAADSSRDAAAETLRKFLGGKR